MPLWRCPHCGTPQAETARCWVCRRSSTTCSTCRSYRRSIAAQIGYCGLDRHRVPLAGTELRGCWQAGPTRAADAVPAMAPDAITDEPAEPPSPALRLRGFVPVELVRREAAAADRASAPAEVATDAPVRRPAATIAAPDPSPAWADRVTLFADAEL